MADDDFPELTPPWSRVPLVHDDTDLFPAPTMDALDERYPPTDLTGLEAAVTTVQEDLATLEELVTEGRLSEDELSATMDSAISPVRRLTDSGRGAVVLTMDDASAQMRIIAQELTARGQLGTFCITTGLLTDPTGVTRITDTDIINFHAAGHEMSAQGGRRSRSPTRPRRQPRWSRLIWSWTPSPGKSCSITSGSSRATKGTSAGSNKRTQIVSTPTLRLRRASAQCRTGRTVASSSARRARASPARAADRS